MSYTGIQEAKPSKSPTDCHSPSSWSLQPMNTGFRLQLVLYLPLFLNPIRSCERQDGLPARIPNALAHPDTHTHSYTQAPEMVMIASCHWDVCSLDAMTVSKST